MASPSFRCELYESLKWFENSGEVLRVKFMWVALSTAVLLAACKKEGPPEKNFGSGDNPVVTDSTNVAPGPAPGHSKSNEVTAPSSHQADQLPK
ncbi:hypothetical protein [Pedosphaera parvula]|uniref:Uncharacterized protein n=1 Tax=Pedosphaera parvula (strain Ellin514) TaxID=320771 RepID=B9XM61_PEDPL|nr:hypothetical protein [Pedosphaera parvula]EEF59054.1 hypothetical protein Cflav_PD2181 [Pedosphaera parvula Ellin514]